MRNNPDFLKLQKVVEDKGYSAEQIEVLTPNQIKQMLDTEHLTCVNGLKQLLIKELRAKQADAELEDFKYQLLGGNRVWFRSHFPDAEFSRDKEFGKKRIVIWLDGKPEEPE